MPPVSRHRYRARRVRAGALALLLVVVVVVVLTRGSSPSVGYDISYPQCSGSFPSNVLWGIVGVNGGRANTANRCLSGELQWARGAPGQRQPRQPPLSLYIDTGDPGDQVADWPKGGRTAQYGSCNGLLTDSCSYLYGEQRAAHAYDLAATLDPAAARTAPWWLDVELTLTWAGTYQLNLAALQGYLAGLTSAGATGPVGIYSTASQWEELTGLDAQTTPAAFGGRQLPDWVAGTAASLAQARANCESAGFTGAAPRLAQYRLGSLDADLRCP